MPGDRGEEHLEFRGEDENVDFASPVMDLTAAAVLAAVALWMMVESLRLPMPGGLFTAPGLLPFLSAAGLLGMTGVLATMALKRRKLLGGSAGGFELPEDFTRSVGLGLIVVVYVAAMQTLPEAWSGSIAGERVTIGSFEVTSLIAVTTVLKIYWGERLWVCFLVTLGWIAFLSLIFRIIFSIPLP